MVDGVNQQPGLFQRIGNFFGANDPNAGQPTDPFAGLSRSQRTMLGFAALRDAAASLEGRDSNFFQSALGGFEQARERERLRAQGEMQNRVQALQALATLNEQARFNQAFNLPPDPAMDALRNMLMQAAGFSGGAAPMAGTALPSAPAPSAVAPATRPAAGGAVMDATGAVVGDVSDEPLSPAAQAAMEETPAPTAGTDFAAQRQEIFDLMLLRQASNAGISDLQARLDEINRQEATAIAAQEAGKETEENRLVSEDAARQARYNRNVISSILNDPALNRVVGRFQGQTEPGTAAGFAMFGEDELNILSKIDQLEGQVFLEARDMLRGGGQITDFEGKRAQTALSRIGQRGVSEEAYRQALIELDQVFANSEARALGQPVPFPEIDTDPDAEAAPLPSGAATHRYNPATGQIEAIR